MKETYKIITSLKEGVHLKSSEDKNKELKSLGFNVDVDMRIGMMYTLECEPDEVETIAKALISPTMEDYLITNSLGGSVL
jgi:phosphoribosylformylglycinamidine (FGAM) synthase PurS component|tara:strand:+ start:734 stop:973 length:240 start_codon:yes stop_codon:yes gene_type:complete